MTTSGEPPTGAGGVHEPDWIDQILERATNQVDRTPSSAGRNKSPIVPDVKATPLVNGVRRSAAPTSAQRTASPADSLAEIQWVDSPQVTPASTPIVTPEPIVETTAPPVALPTNTVQGAPSGLVPEAVGRTAWEDLDGHTPDPEGWDQLSWEDLDERPTAGRSPLKEQTSFGRLLREWGPVLFAAIAIALFTRLVLVQAYHIPSQSMVPTLEDGDRVVVNRLSYQFGEVERGQVVVFAKPQGTDGENDLIKRVIGLPGETIRFVDNQVYINGLRLEEPYLAEQDVTRPRLTIPGCAQVDPMADLCVIPEGFVFMMGDNRLGSSDSRVFGPIDMDNIVGRAFLRVWPLNNLGQL